MNDILFILPYPAAFILREKGLKNYAEKDEKFIRAETDTSCMNAEAVFDF